MAQTTSDASGSKDEKATTILADDLEIDGTIKFKSSLMIKGVLNGVILSEGLLIVGPTAKVTATITTKNIVSHGEIHGDVEASEQIILKNTAVHNGNITTRNIVIEKGSTFNGACSMKREPVVDNAIAEVQVNEETVSASVAEEIVECAVEKEAVSDAVVEHIDVEKAVEEKEAVGDAAIEHVDVEKAVEEQEPVSDAVVEHLDVEKTIEEKEPVEENVNIEHVEVEKAVEQKEPVISTYENMRDASARSIFKKISTHNGNAATPDIAVESGSLFNGTFQMKQEPVVPAADVTIAVTQVKEEAWVASVAEIETATKAATENVEVAVEKEAVNDVAYDKFQSGRWNRWKK